MPKIWDAKIGFEYLTHLSSDNKFTDTLAEGSYELRLYCDSVIDNQVQTKIIECLSQHGHSTFFVYNMHKGNLEQLSGVSPSGKFWIRHQGKQYSFVCSRSLTLVSVYFP